MHVTADGAKEQFGWFDSQLGFDCTFRKVADGSTRCVPSATLIAEHYRDAACTDRVFSANGAVPDGYLETPDCALSEGLTFWHHPQVVGAPAQVYSYGENGVCYEMFPPNGPYFTATELTAGEMVKETIAPQSLTGTKLRPHVRTTDDGAREFLHMFSVALDSPCEPDLMSDNSTRCTPHSFADSNQILLQLFEDAACTQLLHAKGDGCQDSLENYHQLNVESEPVCGHHAHDYAPMTPYDGTVYAVGAACEVEWRLGEEYLALLDLHAVGDILPLSAFVVESSRAIDEGTTRLRRYFSVYEDGSIGRRALWDTVNEVECDIVEDANGVEHCVPTDYLEVTAAFADAACTQPLGIAEYPHVCPAERRPGWARAASGEFYRVTGEFTGATTFGFTYPDGTICTEARRLEHPLFTLEHVTDWDTATRMTEP